MVSVLVTILCDLGRTHIQRVGHEHGTGSHSEDELVVPGVGNLLSFGNGLLHVHGGDRNGSTQNPARQPRHQLHPPPRIEATEAARDAAPAGLLRPLDQLQVCRTWKR